MALLASASRRLAARAARPGRRSSAASRPSARTSSRSATSRGPSPRRLYPIAGEVDRLHRYPGEVVSELGEMGMMGMMVEEAHGGGDMDALSYAVALEEVSRGCASTGVIMSVNNSLYCAPVRANGDEAQLAEFLAPFAAGEKLGCFGLSEPGSGSDAGAASTTARDDGDAWVLNGTKAWITNAHEADAAVVFATTDKSLKHRGISAFLVDRGPRASPSAPPGQARHPRSSTANLIMEDCRIPKSCLLGERGDGFKIAMRTLVGGRIGIAAQALGIGQAALDVAATYAADRTAFGKPLTNLYAIQLKISEMACKLEAAPPHVAPRKDAGLAYTKDAAMASSARLRRRVDGAPAAPHKPEHGTSPPRLASAALPGTAPLLGRLEGEDAREDGLGDGLLLRDEALVVEVDAVRDRVVEVDGADAVDRERRRVVREVGRVHEDALEDEAAQEEPELRDVARARVRLRGPDDVVRRAADVVAPRVVEVGRDARHRGEQREGV
ncbi:oxidoreductase [Aureococcus anophagefferens]|nr:oxidoreductase [Aureococcus anophagefferens]